MLKAIIILGVLLCVGTLTKAEEPGRYVPETDPLVLEKLEEWQDMKFGLLMHWGTYSQWGIVESWSLCPEDYGWCVREKGATPKDYFAYKREYEGLKNTFNPVRFDPARWAEAAAAAGMRYVVFTTKHHDGFSMFDSKDTDYKITDKDCPFHTNPRADVTKAIFDAFRGKGMWTGAYFSKPDWNNEHYWTPNFPPQDRNVNYDPELYPERWERFVQFTHSQVMQLMSDYGKVDILWLDGGWVAKKDPADIQEWYAGRVAETPSGFLKHRIVNQDIRMDELAAKAREKQPGLIVVDRAVHGKNQNYLTPENRVPEKELPYPWESCIIAGGSWSWVKDAQYKSTREAVHLLVDIVAKGGNLLLNIAPAADGSWDEGAYAMLKGIGDWMAVSGEAIYGTRAIAPYKSGRVCFTQKPDEGIIYAIYLAAESETAPPSVIAVEGITPVAGSRVTMLGVQGDLAWERNDEGFEISVPVEIINAPPSADAWAFRISKNTRD